jgi:pimeloyl-ACP methyl ester carboxylesterase
MCMDGDVVDAVDVGGLRIAFQREGRGPPLVLLHGFVGDGVGTWAYQLLEALSDAFTVIAWDGPGAGHSSATSTGSPASRAPALDQTGRVSWASTRFSSRSRAVPESLRLADYADCLSRVPARLGPGPPGDARKKIRRQWRAFVLTTGCINFNRLRTVRSGLSALKMWPYWLALGRA